MSAQRVVGSDAAREAAREMRRILEGSLSANMQALVVQGRTLSNPTAWDGAAALTFRQQQWPPVERSVLRLQQALPAMHANVSSVLETIIRAGTAGGTLAALWALDRTRRLATSLRPPITAALAAYNSSRLGIGVQGAANEGALLDQLTRGGSTAYDLNFLRPGNRGQNFPLLDTASDEGFFSAKAYFGPSALSRYNAEFMGITSGQFGRAPGQLRQAVNLLDANRDALQAADAWPRGLATDASTADIRAFILDNAKLAIPNDQVAPLADLVRTRATQFPENYGLDVGATTEEVDRLLQRIVPSGTDSRAIQTIGSYFSRLDGVTPTLRNATAFVTRVMESPAGKVLKVGGMALAAVGDVFTIANPSPDALGGPTTERVMAGLNLAAIGIGAAAPLLAANAALDWIPGVGEVMMAATAAYFVGDLIYQNRQWLEDTGSHLLHGAGNVAAAAWHGLTSWL
jgi:uncharacterized protein YukE